MDIWPKAKRSAVMGRIRGRNTKPELLLRSLLHRSGLRYSLRTGGLPGRPDIVLPKFRTVIFVHGCFWHRHPGCPVATMPKTRTAFWQAKFDSNVQRDARNGAALRKLGWKVLVVWECHTLDNPAQVLARIRETLGLSVDPGYHMPDRRILMRVAESRLQRALASAAAGSDAGSRRRNVPRSPLHGVP